jgi:hypothetical protein
MQSMLIIPDGVGIRNFLCTAFPARLLERGPVTVWHALPPEVLAPHRQRWGNAVRWAALPPYPETVRERLLRQAKLYAQMYWFQAEDHSDSVMKLYFRYPSRDWRHRQLTRASRLLGRLCGGRRGTQWLDRQHARAVARRAAVLAPFRATLAESAPTVVFNAHQRASRSVPALLAARQAGIPTATFVYSWDNPPKGRMAVHADHFLVWSEFMAAEMRRYYPEQDPARIHVTGTPQFEPYFDTALHDTREAFFAAHGLDPRRPVVLYSGDDHMASPHDPLYLADLAGALRGLPEAKRPQLLFRRCPTDTSGRHEPVLERYPAIRRAAPLWRHVGGDWTQVAPTPDDVRLLVNTVRHCDLVVNIGSTMAMDFAVLDKPALYLAYDQPQAPPDIWNQHDFYRHPHFARLHELQPVWWARSPAEIGPAVQDALTRPETRADARRAWVRTHVREPLQEASQRLVATLASLA